MRFFYFLLAFTALIGCHNMTHNSTPLEGRFFYFQPTLDKNFCNEDSLLAGDCNGGSIYFTKKGNVIYEFNCVEQDSIDYFVGKYTVTEKKVECKFSKVYSYGYSDIEPYTPNYKNAVIKDSNWNLLLNKVECKSKIEYCFTQEWDEGDELMVLYNADSLETKSYINSINEIKALDGL